MNRFSASGPRRRGFTLVETLVVIGLISVLMAVLVPALNTVTSAGRMTNEMSAARQLMVAYSSYASEYRDSVMPGVKSGLPARDARGRNIDDVSIPVASARYPWRIAPYMDYTFRGLFMNGQQEILEEIENLANEEWSIYFHSLVPSLGINATWVGGNEHPDEMGFDDAYQDLFGRFYVERTSEVRRPGKLIVFGSARGVDPLGQATGVVQGYFEVRSPWLTEVSGERWSESFEASESPSAFGFVSPRYRGEAVTAMMDGHVENMNEDRLRDMRHWANRATREDFALTRK